jgi:hypothetical protein
MTTLVATKLTGKAADRLSSSGSAPMDLLIKHAEGLLSVDWKTLTVIAVLCGFAAYFIKDYLANPPMVIFVYPVLVFCSVLAHYLIILAETYQTKKLDQWLMWTVLASICGTIVGTLLVASLASLRERFSGRSV